MSTSRGNLKHLNCRSKLPLPPAAATAAENSDFGERFLRDGLPGRHPSIPGLTPVKVIRGAGSVFVRARTMRVLRESRSMGYDVGCVGRICREGGNRRGIRGALHTTTQHTLFVNEYIYPVHANAYTSTREIFPSLPPCHLYHDRNKKLHAMQRETPLNSQASSYACLRLVSYPVDLPSTSSPAAAANN